MERSAWLTMIRWQRWTGLHIRRPRILQQIFRLLWELLMGSKLTIRWWTAIRAKLGFLPRIKALQRESRNRLLARRLPKALSTQHMQPTRNSSKQLMSHHSLVPEGAPQKISLLLPINLDLVLCGKLKISATLPSEALLFIKEIKILKNGGKSLHSIRISNTESHSWKELWDRKTTRLTSAPWPWLDIWLSMIRQQWKLLIKQC